jgi:signal transduction histidine kinase
MGARLFRSLRFDAHVMPTLADILGDRPVAVVLIDGDRDWHRLLAALLAGAGPACRMHAVATFEEGTRLVEEQQADVFLIGQHLDGGEGLSVIRASTRRGLTTPMILLTGAADQALGEQALRAGAADYLSKGNLDTSRLWTAIRHALSRQRALEDLRHAEQQLRAQFNAVPNPTYVWRATSDGDFVLIDVNEAAVKATRSQILASLGCRASAFFADRPDLTAAIRECLEQRAVVRREGLFVMRTTGEQKYLSATCAFVAPDTVSSYTEDLTERWQAECAVRERERERVELERQLRHVQRLESVGRLAGGIAHDFNNLLTAILGFAELLSATFEPDDPRRADLCEIQRAAHSAATLTHQLLAFSRKQILQPVLLDLNDQVAGVQGLLQRLLGESVVVSTECTASGLPITADPTQLEQILLNLAINARDAMPCGGTVTMRTDDVEVGAGTTCEALGLVPGSYVRLTVTDTGSGIAPDVMPHIFEPFFTTKPRGRGTGLGLATVYGIVKQSGGSVGVRSSVGAGTSFDVYLPVAAPPAVIELGPALREEVGGAI